MSFFFPFKRLGDKEKKADGSRVWVNSKQLEASLAAMSVPYASPPPLPNQNLSSLTADIHVVVEIKNMLSLSDN